MELFCPCGSGQLIRKVTRGGPNVNRCYYKCPGSDTKNGVPDCKFYSFEDELKQCACGRGFCRTFFKSSELKFWCCCVKGDGACKFYERITSTSGQPSRPTPLDQSSSSSQRSQSPFSSRGSSSKEMQNKNELLVESLKVAQDVIMTPNRDIIFTVLSLLPTKSLVRFKSVSKEWQCLISENGFAKIQLKTKEPTSGFLFQERYKWSTGDISTISYISAKDGSAKQGKMLDFLPEDVVLLSTCNGLVFCRSCFKCYPWGDLFLYICNPLNKEWITVDDIELDRILVIALAFDPELDLLDTATHFKLVRVREFETEMEDRCYSFEIYSSRTGSWKKSLEVCYCEDNLYKNDGFYIGGSLHWMTDGNQILTFNVESERSWLVLVPIPATGFEGIHAACIGAAEGKLHYVSVSDLGFQVWSLDDYFDSSWSLKHSKSLKAMEVEHPKSLCYLHARVKRQLTSDTPMVAPLSFSDGFLLLRVRKELFVYDFKLNVLREVCSEAPLCANSMYHPVVLPYTPSLLSLK